MDCKSGKLGLSGVQKYILERNIFFQDAADSDYKAKVEANKKAAEERTAKKRKKRSAYLCIIIDLLFIPYFY